MRHFVVFHNPDSPDNDGHLDPKSAPFAIWTTKPALQVRGNRVWLVTRTDGPKPSYWIASTFVASTVKPGKRPDDATEVSGRTGQRPGRVGNLKDQPWWPELKRATGNFAFGLSEIKDEGAIRGLETLAGGTEAPSPEATGRQQGAGFGDYESNREVELAAVRAVTDDLEKQGWTVASVESLKCGYDLDCTRRRDNWHVEVKGVSGTVPEFVITKQEAETAKTDRAFRLAVVTSARPSPSVTYLPGDTFLARYDLRPVAYFARRKTK